MCRVDFLVDGFNVFHSLKRASQDIGSGASTRWLDLHGLLASYLPLFGREARLGTIFYFSALAHYLSPSKPGVVQRHLLYIDALKSTGVQPVMGRFKEVNPVKCRTCGSKVRRREEKESDVAIGVKLLERCVRNEAEIVVLVTGDTDLVPAVRTALALFPRMQVNCIFPYRRKNNELARVASGSFNISKENYLNHQFESPLTLRSGRELLRPENW